MNFLERSRSRRKKRDFFGTIKKRLSRSKNRSKSMDPGERDESLGRDASLSRSVSADRARDASLGDPNRVAGKIKLAFLLIDLIVCVSLYSTLYWLVSITSVCLNGCS
jgi:hypothetical protein